MNENSEFHATYRGVLGVAWILLATVGAILLVVGIIFSPFWYSLTLSYVLGTMTNLFAFNLLKTNIANVTADHKSAVTASFTNYVLRLAIYTFILYISFQYSKLNPYIVASGYLTIRISIYIYTWNHRKEENACQN